MLGLSPGSEFLQRQSPSARQQPGPTPRLSLDAVHIFTPALMCSLARGLREKCLWHIYNSRKIVFPQFTVRYRKQRVIPRPLSFT